MARFTHVARLTRIVAVAASPRARVLLQLSLLAVGLLAVAAGAGAPGCLPDGTGTC